MANYELFDFETSFFVEGTQMTSFRLTNVDVKFLFL